MKKNFLRGIVFSLILAMVVCSLVKFIKPNTEDPEPIGTITSTNTIL